MTCKILTTSLDEFDNNIFISTKQARQKLGLSRDTLDRHRNDLLDEKLPEFEWYFYGGGYDYKSLEAINQYAQLVKIFRSTARAKDIIKKHMEEFWNDHRNKTNR